MIGSYFWRFAAVAAVAVGLGSAASESNAAPYLVSLQAPSQVVTGSIQFPQVSGPGPSSISDIVAESFTTGFGGSNPLSNIFFEASTNDPDASIVVTLWSANGLGTSPVDLIRTLATIPTADLITAFGSNGTGIVWLPDVQNQPGMDDLGSNTTYFIGLTLADCPATMGGCQSTDELVTSNTATGPTVIYPSQTGAQYLQFCVDGDGSCQLSLLDNTLPILSTPEPASLAILGFALTGLGLSRRRRGKGNLTA